MRDRLILLPGWGLGISPMEPLAAALQGLDEHLTVSIEPLPGLELLAQMDIRDALQAFRGPQLHLFAGQDGLVPAEAAGALFALMPDIEIGLIEQASHAFLLEDPHGLAGAIQAFLHECADD